MNIQSFNQSIQPSVLEQVVVPTIDGLRKCEKLLGYEFQETIYHLEKLYDLKTASVLDTPLTPEQLRNSDGICPRHHVSLVISEYGNPDSDMDCPFCEQERKETN